MLRELKLVGDISVVELREGRLTVTIGGEEQSYPIAVQAAPSPKPPKLHKADEMKPSPPAPPADSRPNGAAHSVS